jgi:hypothetical protein
VPTRKQRRRTAKSKRHEYEFVYVDDDGNEVEAPEEGLEAASQTRQEGRTNGAKSAAPPSAKAKAKPAAGRRGGRSARTPPPPTWRRSIKRAAILGAVVFALFALGAHGKTGGYTSAVLLAVLYTALFVPFTYAIDRFAYRRWQARQEGGAGSPRKR